MKKIISFLRSFGLAIFILYLFNQIAESIDMYLPINIVTVFVVGTLEISGLILLIILKLII